jgi:transposase
VGEVCRKAGISEATYYNWRKKYAGLMPSEMKRLRQLKIEPRFTFRGALWRRQAHAPSAGSSHHGG